MRTTILHPKLTLIKAFTACMQFYAALQPQWYNQYGGNNALQISVT